MNRRQFLAASVALSGAAPLLGAANALAQADPHAGHGSHDEHGAHGGHQDHGQDHGQEHVQDHGDHAGHDMHAHAASSQPPLPWEEVAARRLPPGQPGEHYDPVFVPNGATLPFKIVDGAKVFHLVAQPVSHRVAGELVIKGWGYNGRLPGPVIEAVEGDFVRVYVTNKLPVATVVHWHGVLLPCGMDGVAGLTQPPIPPGQTFLYEFWLPHAGTFMYHSHLDSMTQEGMGLNGMLVVHPRLPKAERPGRDFVLLMHTMAIKVDTTRPDTGEMNDFNILTLNGKAYPDTHPLVCQRGDRVRIRVGNLSAMDHHPFHIHGLSFKVVETDGGQVPESARWPETTILVPVGSLRVMEFMADNPGDWFLHCHMTHHTMNQMGHGLPNMVGVDARGVDEKIRKLLPGYMSMGQTGMHAMQEMGMTFPKGSIPMLGAKLQFGWTEMGGMTTVVKIRDQAAGYADPGPYAFPKGTVSRRATAEERKRDGIA